MEDKLTEQFSCPICFEIPPAEIYQCINGHTVCSECSKSIHNCPECRVKLGRDKIRNRALETILDSRKYDCPNKEMGCTGKFLRKEIPGHLKICQLQHSSISLCKLLGYKCDFKVNTTRIHEAMTHFKTVHKSPYHRTCNGKIILENFANTNPSKTSVWTPTILEGISETKPTTKCIVLAKINGADKTFSLITLLLGPSPEDVGGYSVHYVVRTNKDNVRPMEWTTTCFGPQDAEAEINEPTFRIPATKLKTKYSREGFLELFVMVKPKYDRDLHLAYAMLEADTVHVVNQLPSQPSNFVTAATAPPPMRTVRNYAAPTAISWVTQSHAAVADFSVYAGVAYGRRVFVARAQHSGGMIPGTLVMGASTIQFPYNMQELSSSEYEVLVAPPDSWCWVRCEGGNIPVQAIAGGYDPNGEPYYIGRVFHNAAVSVGKVHLSHQSCYVAYAGKEHGYKTYEILVSRQQIFRR